MSTITMNISSSISLSSILKPAFSGVPSARALVKFIISAAAEAKRGGYGVRFYITGDIAAAIRPALERLGIKVLPAQELKPPYIFIKLEEGKIVIETSDGYEEFTVGKADPYEFIGSLYDIILEALYPRKKSRDRREKSEEMDRKVYLDEYIEGTVGEPEDNDKH